MKIDSAEIRKVYGILIQTDIHLRAIARIYHEIIFRLWEKNDFYTYTEFFMFTTNHSLLIIFMKNQLNEEN